MADDAKFLIVIYGIMKINLFWQWQIELFCKWHWLLISHDQILVAAAVCEDCTILSKVILP